MFVIVGGFVVAVLLVALLAPFFVDWTGYRAHFEREASKILGQPVTVAGQASARILPFPSLSFTNIRVGADVENPTLTMEQFSLDAELSPFLSGEILIFDMRVTKPHGVINVSKDGAIDWMVRPTLPVDALNVSIENLVIEDGQFVVNDEASQRSHTLNLEKAIVSAKAMQGPWRLVGSARVNDEPVDLTISTGQVEDGALSIAISAFVTRRSLVIEADGAMTLVGSSPRYGGKFQLRPALASDATGEPARSVNTALSKSYAVSGQFDLASTGLTLPEFKLETGPLDNRYTANGSGTVVFGAVPSFEINIAGSQVTLGGQITSGRKVVSGKKEPDPAAIDIGFDERLSSFQRFVDAVPFPAIPGSISANIPAIVAGDTTISDIAFTAIPKDGAWRVKAFKATLPGRTQLEADGILQRGVEFGGAGFGFAGSLLLASNQPAGLVKWMNGTSDTLLRKLTAIGFSSSVRLEPDKQSFADLELALAGATLKGNAERRTDGARPVITLALNGGALDLSDFSGLTSADLSLDLQSLFVGHDVNLTLDVGPISQPDVTIASAGLSLRVKPEGVEIDRLMITDLAGASISATGTLNGAPDALSGNLDLSLVSASGGSFVDILGKRFPDNAMVQDIVARLALVPELLTDLQASMILSTAFEAGARAITISMNAKTASGNYVVGGNLKGMGTAFMDGNIEVSIQEQDPLTLVALAGIPLVPLGAPGPGLLELSGKGNSDTGLAMTAKFVAPGTQAQFNGVVAQSASGPAVSGQVQMTSKDFDPYLTASGMLFSGVGTGTSVDLNAKVETNQQGLAFSSIDGQLNDTKVTGALTFAAGARSQVSGKLQANQIDIGWMGKNLFGIGAADLGGRAPFATNPVAPFDGRIVFSTDVLDMGRVGQARDANGTLNFTANGIRFEKVSASLFGGALLGSLEMRNDGGNGVMSAEFGLTRAEASALPLASVLIGKVDVKGSFSSGAKTLEGLTSALTGSGVARVIDGAVVGLSPNAFSAIAAASKVGIVPPSNEDVKGLIARSVRTGSFVLQPKDLAWVMSSGRIRMPGLKGQSTDADLDANVTADVGRSTFEVDGAVVYQAGKDSVIGAEPTVPFVVKVAPDQTIYTTNPGPLLQFLTQSVLEREQARVEALQSALVEKQRLRRDIRLVTSLYTLREKKRQLREEATRAKAARDGAELARKWQVEKARLDAAAKVERDKAAAAEAVRRAKTALEIGETKQLNPVPGDAIQLSPFKVLEFGAP